ncbi:hypothetical protein S40285_02809 [Stachybotrys chlorohalonatus IBT 40285]|uniref:Rhodopsin domain-containing protein n=1 Tax=Stachybotrys chlorohalonatus (strain IBT 40285) TaxID=1283841 RepID=A0A084QDA9_STAC4|nr:hypothetical protein S40285_02809 [Stachybotrys chlorohalonata IBT 40285]
MSLYSEAPPWREFRFDKPSLLVCWWITLFCTVIILLRVAGRFIRTERLFIEDKIAALALVPLYGRMAMVHIVLLYGTNNVSLGDHVLSQQELRNREIGSRLVLVSRILYAATLWILKSSILEFLGRLTGLGWERFHRSTLSIFRWTLVGTFAVVVISDLAECQPFDHYWQILPDPGGQCRQGYVQLITMGVCNVVTDLMLVAFPIPLIVGSHLSIKKKVQLSLLFSLSLFVVGVTLFRIPHIIWQDGRQQYRSLLASIELLFATASSNSLVLGSFVRDRGVKKQKFRQTSEAESYNRTPHFRRPALQRFWGSDEDLVRDMGITLDPELGDRRDSAGHDAATFTIEHFKDDPMRWGGLHRQRSHAERSDDSLLPHDQFIGGAGSSTPPRKISFLDMGGLLGGPKSFDDCEASPSQPRPLASLPASSSGVRRGSTALLQDIGGLLGPPSPNGRKYSRSKPSRSPPDLQPVPLESHENSLLSRRNNAPVLMDMGGLLK